VTRPRSVERRDDVTLAAAALVFCLQLAYLAPWTRFDSTIDLLVYRAAAVNVLGGRSPYAGLAGLTSLFTYPPFAAMAFIPTRLVDAGVLRAAATTVSLAAILVATACVVGVAADVTGRRLAAIVLAGSALALASQPAWYAFRLGQVDLILLALVLLDLRGLPRRLPRGVLIGLAAGIKVVPGIFIVYLALTGRARAASVALATFAATVVLGALVMPGAAYDYWTRFLWDIHRVGPPDRIFNQSLRGMLLRLHVDGVAVWLAVAVAVAVVGAAIAVALHRRGDAALSITTFALTGLLVAPISWIHHWVWAVPFGLAALASAHEIERRGWRRLAYAAVCLWFGAFVVSPIDLAARAWLPHGARTPAEDLYVIAALVALAVLGVVSLRSPRGAAPYGAAPRARSG